MPRSGPRTVHRYSLGFKLIGFMFSVVRDAWGRGQPLTVQGWIYDLGDGLLRDLGICITSPAELPALADAARAAM